MSQSRYQELVAKVDAKAQELQILHGNEIKCKKHCSSCCQAGLSVFSVERDAIKSWLLQQSEEFLSQLERTKDSAQACAFLDAAGACQIYPVRPLICRTQGLPLAFKHEDRRQRDVCPLNFVAQDLASLPDSAVLNLDLLNTLLVLVDRFESGESAGQRFALSPGGIMGDAHLP